MSRKLVRISCCPGPPTVLSLAAPLCEDDSRLEVFTTRSKRLSSTFAEVLYFRIGTGILVILKVDGNDTDIQNRDGKNQ